MSSQNRTRPLGPRRAARSARPVLESLEGRTLLDASLPDLAMISATTSDSQGVTITYRVQGAAIAGTVPIAIERSSDARFDPSVDLPLGRLDLSGENLTVGPHTITVPLQGGLPIDPSHPYVLAVADPNNVVPESDESNNVASFRTFVIGAVAHGTELTPGFPAWVGVMAASLRQDGYDVAIPFDWSTLSRLPIPGAVSIAGRQLAGAVSAAVRQLLPALGPDDVIDLHLIGHSRGAAVISQAALDLQAIEQAGALPQLRAGWQKLTFLAPHPVHNVHLDGSTRQYFSISTGPLGRLVLLGYQRFAAAVQDPDVVLPSDVNEAEVFYQHTNHRQTFSPDEGPLANLSEKIYVSWGEVPIYGGPAHYYDLTGIVHGHYEVHDWYQQNVVPTLGTAAPFRFAGSTATPAPNQFSTAIPPTPEPGALAFEVRLLSPAIVKRPALARAIEHQLAAAEAAFVRGHQEAVIGNLSYLLRLLQARRGQITPAAYAFAVSEVQSILGGLQGLGLGLSSSARS